MLGLFAGVKLVHQNPKCFLIPVGHRIPCSGSFGDFGLPCLTRTNLGAGLA